MIIIIKGKDYRRLFIKSLSIVFLFIMFYFYYQHMSNKFKTQNEELNSKLSTTIETIKKDKSIEFEKLIYKEAVVIVDLIEQKHVQSVKVVKDKLLIVCDYNTDIEPLLIRYGVNALIKNTAENIKIAIDLKTIVENKYEI